jgi:4-hydroxy-tetrahydrodipicolinate synthase
VDRFYVGQSGYFGVSDPTMNGFKSVSKAQDICERLANGLIAATPVPFDGNGRLHEAGHESYLNFMARQPVAGVAVWAHTGRGLMLDHDTAQRVLRDWREALPEGVIVAGAGSRNSNPRQATADTVAMAERARRAGADALLVYPPTWLIGHPSPDQLIIEHHRQVAAVGLPLILFYLYEAAGGIAYSPQVLEELLSLPGVVGIKMATLDSVMTYQDVSRQLRARHPEQLFITGEDRFLGYSLRLGASAALIGMGAICCDLQAELIRAHTSGDATRFLTLSDKVDRLAESIFIQPMEGYIRRLLWALVHLGVIPLEAANDPWGPQLSPDEFANVGRTLKALKALKFETQEC